MTEPMTDDDLLGDSDHLRRAPRWILFGAAGLLVAVAAMAITAWIAVALSSTQNPGPAIEVTACTPESYDAPELGQEGPPQEECERWFAAPDDAWPIDQPIRVVGQVCNRHTEPVAYEYVRVAFESVDVPGLQVLAIDVPITYDPGCQPAYDFEFEIPLSVKAAVDPETGSAGKWRIVGEAEPVRVWEFETYQWDSTATVELVGD